MVLTAPFQNKNTKDEVKCPDTTTNFPDKVNKYEDIATNFPDEVNNKCPDIATNFLDEVNTLPDTVTNFLAGCLEI